MTEPPDKKPPNTERGAPEPVEQQRRPIGEVLVATGAATKADVVSALQQQLAGDERRLGTILLDEGKAAPVAVDEAVRAQAPRRHAAGSTVRVDVALLDDLLELVGELALTRNQLVRGVVESTDPATRRSSRRLDLLTAELREGIMRTRMQPIDKLWSRLTRQVGALSKTYGKPVTLDLQGRETPLDRDLLQALKGPLAQLVRHAIAHGVEAPEDRRAGGKSPQSILTLRARIEGRQVVLEVADDGARREDDGAGLAAVTLNIERLGGAVVVDPVPGVGTTRRLTIPLTLATFQALTVVCAEQRYVVPHDSVLEMVFIDGESTKIEYEAGAPVYRLRGKLLPLVRLDRTLGLPVGPDRGVYLVVLRAGVHSFGLVVDHVLNSEEAVIKALGARLPDIGRYAGATILSTGTVAPILDIASLARRSNLPPGPQRSPTENQQRVTELLEVRRAILAADPNFYNDLHDEALVEA